MMLVNMTYRNAHVVPRSGKLVLVVETAVGMGVGVVVLLGIRLASIMKFLRTGLG